MGDGNKRATCTTASGITIHTDKDRTGKALRTMQTPKRHRHAKNTQETQRPNPPTQDKRRLRLTHDADAEVLAHADAPLLGEGHLAEAPILLQLWFVVVVCVWLMGG